ncbi:MAG TPA: hypothetical protein VKD69_03320 [Vicinamibacterales bacterium]|nr:hypothetical protein [Vicinamibacterales bacterium]
MKLRRFRARLPSWARYDIWNVGIAALDRPLEAVADLLPLEDVRWLPPQPPLHYIADPFPYRHGDRDWLLVEHYGHPRGVRGRIARIAVGAPASAAPPTTVIARDRHVSYPYVFTDGTRTYCAPEMSQEDGCAIYALRSDGEWTQAHHVLRGRRLVDATIFRHERRWWLLGTEPPPQHNLVLNAFYADALDGPWHAHAANPVKRDLASARPAGRPLLVNGQLYRPAQDCSETYGGAVHLMEVLALTPTEFRERIALRVEPDPSWPYPDGLHHLVVDGTRVYFDAKRTHVDWLLGLRT